MQNIFLVSLHSVIDKKITSLLLYLRGGSIEAHTESVFRVESQDRN